MATEMHIYISRIMAAVSKQQLGKTNALSLYWCLKIRVLRSRGLLRLKLGVLWVKEIWGKHYRGVDIRLHFV